MSCGLNTLDHVPCVKQVAGGRVSQASVGASSAHFTLWAPRGGGAAALAHC